MLILSNSSCRIQFQGSIQKFLAQQIDPKQEIVFTQATCETKEYGFSCFAEEKQMCLYTTKFIDI